LTPEFPPTLLIVPAFQGLLRAFGQALATPLRGERFIFSGVPVSGASSMRKLALTLIVALTASVLYVQSAAAIAPFQAAFIKLYVNDHEDKEFAKYVKTKAKCHICHQGKVSPKNVHHNAYGVHLVELLDAKTDKKDVDKINEALAKVAEMHSDPEDEKSPTYGELIAQSKLPGGELEESQKEPSEKESAQ
jgi:hypothetical protein